MLSSIRGGACTSPSACPEVAAAVQGSTWQRPGEGQVRRVPYQRKLQRAWRQVGSAACQCSLCLVSLSRSLQSAVKAAAHKSRNARKCPCSRAPVQP